jgi:hypothetical protein
LKKLSAILFILLACFYIITPVSSVLAAPAPWGIAINTETQQCAGYWAGDEFTAYPLPDGWEAYYPEFAGGSALIETPYGDCDFISEQDCCEELGFEYISDNIGIENTIAFYDDIETGMPDMTMPIVLVCFSCCGLSGIIVLVVVIIFIVHRRKRSQRNTST